MKMFRSAGAALIAAAAIAGALFAQPFSQEPITDFHLPVFSKRDVKTWDVRGAQAIYRSKDRIDLTKLHVTMYTGDTGEAVDVELYTPAATVELDALKISGSGLIHVVGRGAELLGENWHYHEEPASPADPAAKPTKVFVIERNAVVTFTGDLGNVLQ